MTLGENLVIDNIKVQGRTAMIEDTKQVHHTRTVRLPDHLVEIHMPLVVRMEMGMEITMLKVDLLGNRPSHIARHDNLHLWLIVDQLPPLAHLRRPQQGHTSPCTFELP